MDFLVILLVIIFGFLILGFLITKKQGSKELTEIIRILQSSSAEDRKMLLQSLSSNTDSLNQRLDNAAKVILDVQRNLGEMSEVGRSMKDLQSFLSSPKLRGNIGEHILSQLLSQSLPKSSFNLQYSFRSGEKVDAAIKTSAGIIPIDSKFPMENFRKFNSSQKEEDKKIHLRAFEKDIKLHIDSISRKYILPDEGTMDYALMYIPSEAVYYEVVNNESIFDYASSKRVLPVSPTTFYAYLKAILMSFEGQKVEAKAKEILSSLRAIQKDYQKVDENLSTLGRHLGNAQNMMSTVAQSYSLLGQKISTVRSLGEETKEEVKELSKSG